MRNPACCICKDEGADQLHGSRAADQHLCFRYMSNTISLLLNPKFKASSHFLWLYSLICVRPDQKPRRQVFSRRSSVDFVCSEVYKLTIF